MSAKIGFYSGTFDPIHDGHVAFAEAVLDDLGLDRVIFLPERNPRGKQNVTAVEVRAQRISEKIADNPKLCARVLDELTFTLPDTLNFLRSEYPNADFTFLFGSDVALHILNWPKVEILLQGAHIAVGLRGDTSGADIINYFAQPPNITNYSVHTTDHKHASSSQMR